MAIALGINNVITFITSLSPILIGSFFILSSVYNVDFSGFIWFGGIVLLQVIAILLRKYFGEKYPNKWLKTAKYKNKDPMEQIKDLPHDYCSIFEPLFPRDKLTFFLDNHVLFHSFTLGYLINIFSIYNDERNIIKNFIYVYVVILILDIGYRIGNKCIKFKQFNFFIAIGLGLGLGYGFSLLIKLISQEYYHKYLLFGSIMTVDCNIDDAVFKCKPNNNIAVDDTKME